MMKCSIIRALLTEKIGQTDQEESLARALSRLHLPDTDAMEWRTKKLQSTTGDSPGQKDFI